MGGTNWLCCSSSDSVQTSKDKPNNKNDLSSRKPVKKGPPSSLVITEPPKSNPTFLVPPTPMTPTHEIPTYVKVLPLIPEPIPKRKMFNVRSSDPNSINRSEIILNLDQTIEGNRRQGKLTTIIQAEDSQAGGEGKSTFVRQYIEKYSDKYQYIVWIDAENGTTIQNSIFDIAAKLGKFLYDEFELNKYKRSSILAKEVFRVLCRYPSLIVFDNFNSQLPDCEQAILRDYFPTCLSDRVKPVILVTAVTQRSQAFAISPIPESSLASFLLARLEIADKPKNVELASTIVQMASQSPLLVQLAISVIKNHSSEDFLGFELNPLQDFIDIYERSKRRFLPLRPSDAKSHSFLHVLVMILMAKIQADEKHGQVASTFLECIAYLPSVKIPKKILAHFFPLESSKVVEGALELLKNTSLIHEFPDDNKSSSNDNESPDTAIRFLNMPRVVQEAIKEITRVNGQEGKVLNRLIKEVECMLIQGVPPEDPAYRYVLACGIEIEEHIQDQYFNSTYLDFASSLIEKIIYVYFDKAGEISGRVIAHNTEVHGREHRETLMAQHDLALSLLYQKKYTEAVTSFTEIQDLSQKFLGKNSRPSLYLSLRLAAALTAMGKYEKAQELYEDSLVGWNSNGDGPTRWNARFPKEIMILVIKYQIAFILQQRNESEKALAILNEILPERVKKTGENDYGALRVRLLLASVLHSMKRSEEAGTELKQVQSIAESKYGDAHPITVNALRLQARIKNDEGQYEEAFKVFEKLLEIQLKHFVLEPEVTMKMKSSGSLALIALKKFDEALQLFSQASDFGRAMLDGKDPLIVANEASIGNVLKIQGRVQEALEMFARVYELQKEIYGAKHEKTLSTKDNVARLVRENPSFEPAIRMYTDVLSEAT